MNQTNWLILNKSLFCVLLFGFYSNLNAQNTFQDYKKQYPDFNEIILNDNQSYDFSIEKNKIKVIQDNHFESIILNENGINNNQESFSYSELVKLKSYEAFSIINNNGKEKKIKVTQTNEKQVNESSVFFNDVKKRQLIFPNLEPGSKKVYDYQTEFLDPFLLHKYIFANNIPVKNASFEITTEKDINIGYKVFNDPNSSIQFTKSEKKGKWLYKWQMQDISPIKMEGNSPGYMHIVPHLNVYIKDYLIDNTKIEVLDNEEKLFNYYKSFVKNLNTKEDANLKAKSIEVTSNLKTDEDKVKAIFYWVKDNIKYIAFENGYEGFIPREASLVCERKFGDCKDMASIISAMAKYANVPNVTIAWIGTREIPYSYSELSTPAVDNHMIAVFKNAEEYIFLDGTDKETRYGIPTAFIQSKEAMISENGKYKILNVPTVSADKNEIKEFVKLKIINDKIIGSGKNEYIGYNRSSVLSQIGDVTNKTRFEMIKSLVLKGNNKFTLKDFTEQNQTDRDKPYEVNYNFELENYVIKVDKEMYVNMFLDKYFETLTIESDRVAKFDFDYLTSYKTQYQLEIPINYSLKYKPENFSLDNELMKANFSYEIKNNILFLDIAISEKKLILDKDKFELWNETIKKIKSNYSETLILLEK